MESSCARSPLDIVKYVSNAVAPPCNLGGQLQLSYFIQRKIDSSCDFGFRDVFTERSWHNRTRPAALSISLRKYQSKYLAAEDRFINSSGPQVFNFRCFGEAAPLSEEGYNNLASDIQNWENFRRSRDMNQNSFTVDDNRTDAERKEEEDLQKKLRAVYKAHKVQSKKLKEKDKSSSAVAAAGPTHGGPTHPLQVPPTIEETNEESEIDGDVDFGEDDPEETPELKELNAAFDEFSTKIKSTSDDVSVGSSNDAILTIETLQSVLIQVFNRFVPMPDILEAYYDETGFDLAGDRNSLSQTLDYNEFRKIHFK